ncbi:pyridoxamine 5'-phosphate oxidase family protein [bacterium]|nr:pyridoxamine 5'-phosphate oxidase family protein [bacterium]
MQAFYQDYYDKAWQLMALGQKSRKSCFRTAAFSTISSDFPELRTVVIRKTDQASQTIVFHTDTRSQKVNELKNNPNCCLLFYSKPHAVQIRVYAQARIHTNNKTAEQRWKTMIPLSKRCYIAKAPGTVLAVDESEHAKQLQTREPLPHEHEQGYHNFAVVQCKVEKIDYLDLNFEGHTRIVFDLSSHILAKKVAP